MATAAIEHRQAELDQFLFEVFGPEKKAAPQKHTTIPAEPPDLDDQELLTRARSANNGAKFTRLEAGNWKNEYGSQ